MPRILVSAGDPSGDLILAAIIRHIKSIRSDIEFVGLCGPACEAEGVKAIASSKDVAVVGISEVLKNIRKIFAVLDLLKREVSKCDAVVCVDFPDFNLKLATMAKKLNVPVDYIVAPQVWAWRGGRVHKMARLLRRLYPALPFEEEIFQSAGLPTKFLGHPIRDLLPPRARREARAEISATPEERVFCLMPGSRRSEIERHLPLLIEAWEEFRVLRRRGGDKSVNRAILPLAPGWTHEGWTQLLKPKHLATFNELEREGTWQIVTDSRRALMAADFGWIVSGTATLEAALYLVPHILVYKLSRSSAAMMKFMSHYFTDKDAAAGLPNILLGRNVIPELLQDDVSARRLAIETYELLHNHSRMNEIEKSLRYLPRKLGDPGATKRIAEDLLTQWK